MLSECSSAKDVKCRRLKVGRETNAKTSPAWLTLGPSPRVTTYEA